MTEMHQLTSNNGNTMPIVGRPQANTRVISFTSGKGGVGKTHTVVNVGLALAGMGKSVLVLDADLGLANIDVLLGLEVHHTLEDVLCGRKGIEEIVLQTSSGMAIIPAASGVESMCQLSAQQHAILLSEIEKIAWQYDYLLVDTPAGIGRDVLFFNSASSEIACIINGDPTSLTDAYALIKVMVQNYNEKEFHVIVNNVSTEYQARKAFRRLQDAVDKFLKARLNYLVHIPADEAVAESIAQRNSVVTIFPSSAAARSLVRLAEKIDANFHSQKLKGGMQFFFRQLLDVGAYGG